MTIQHDGSDYDPEINGTTASEIQINGSTIWTAVPHEDDLEHDYRIEDVSASDGNDIDDWPDAVGSHDLDGNSAGTYPTYNDNGLAGGPCAEFDASEPDTIQGDSSGTVISQPYTVYIVYGCSTTDTHFPYSGRGDLHLFRHGPSGGSIQLNAGDGPSGGSDYANEDSSHEAVVGGVWDGSNSLVFIDPHPDGGYDDASSDPGSNDITDGIKLGSNSADATGSLTFYIARIMFYGSDHTQSERDDVISYLHDEYGI